MRDEMLNVASAALVTLLQGFWLLAANICIYC